MKKLISTILVIVLILSCNFSVFANEKITVKLNDNKISFDVPPRTINGRTMVPLRAIFEAIGATVDWDNATQTVTSIKNNITIKLTVNNSTMYVNDTPVTLDSPACLIEKRTLVPVRAIAEAFNLTVEWDGITNTVIITSDMYYDISRHVSQIETFMSKGLYLEVMEECFGNFKKNCRYVI